MSFKNEQINIKLQFSFFSVPFAAVYLKSDGTIHSALPSSIFSKILRVLFFSFPFSLYQSTA